MPHRFSHCRNALRAVIALTGCSIGEIAELAGVSTGHLQMILTGARPAGPKTRHRIGVALGDLLLAEPLDTHRGASWRESDAHTSVCSTPFDRREPHMTHK